MRNVRRHFGSSHFLFERPYGFSASRAFLVLSCSSVYATVSFYQPILQILVLLMLPALTSTEWAVAHTMLSSKSSGICWDHSCGDSQISKITSFAEMEQNISSLTARVCKIETNAASAPRVSGSARTWPLPTAPQPQGPMIQGLLKRAGTQDADSILFRVQMMKLLEVPFSYDFFANNAMQLCLLGTMKSYLQQPTCPQPRCPSEFTAKQEPLPLDTYVAREVDVKNFWQHTETTFSHLQLIAFSKKHQCHYYSSTIQAT